VIGDIGRHRDVGPALFGQILGQRQQRVVRELAVGARFHMLTSPVRLGGGQQVLEQVGDRVDVEVLEVFAGRQTGIGHRELAP
jgi:hypothetical protein